MIEKPRQSIVGLWNISFGFFGIQIGFALQNANMSRIFQTFGANIDDLPWLWVAAPLTGLLVQPVIGHMSDRTWLGRLGRRRPYFFAGALLAALSLFAMPLAPALLFAAVMLWVLDASLNVSMEPFRAFVGDMLRKDQHAAGYAVQTAFIGTGAVVGSIFPWALEHLGVSNAAADGGIPDTVRFAFWFGGAALFLSVLWTVVTTREYAPDAMAAFDRDAEAESPAAPLLATRSYTSSFVWLAAGALVIWAVGQFGLEKEVYLLGALLLGYGLASAVAIALARAGSAANMLSSIVGDFSGMPLLMKRLAVAQFFSWSALFIMWINTTPIVTQVFYGAADAADPLYQKGANWVDALFATYNGVAAIAALTLLPFLAARIGQARTHIVGLLCGAAGYASFFAMPDRHWLLLSEVGIGIAWASILAMPYAILASSLPQKKLGIYMGLFNVFVVVPQLLVATAMGSIMKRFFPGEPIWTMAFASATLVLAALAMLRVVRLTRG
ncbi:MFS transporter [Sphingomonas sp. Root241]|uniref:MFS transporter n=1 Tax=Sphingomonas sp. Root241 TaxID=1736501 RepID=UPI000701EB02|nr:MFS transporter [Sphingomonas sp. Root241]KRC80903.1 MFS transporter [Sphingomonas sp. Root241]